MNNDEGLGPNILHEKDTCKYLLRHRDFIYYLVDTTAGGRFVHKGITSPLVSTSVLTWISIIWSVLWIHCLQKYELFEILLIFLTQA